MKKLRSALSVVLAASLLISGNMTALAEGQTSNIVSEEAARETTGTVDPASLGTPAASVNKNTVDTVSSVSGVSAAPAASSAETTTSTTGSTTVPAEQTDTAGDGALTRTAGSGTDASSVSESSSAEKTETASGSSSESEAQSPSDEAASEEMTGKSGEEESIDPDGAIHTSLTAEELDARIAEENEQVETIDETVAVIGKAVCDESAIEGFDAFVLTPESYIADGNFTGKGLTEQAPSVIGYEFGGTVTIDGTAVTRIYNEVEVETRDQKYILEAGDGTTTELTRTVVVSRTKVTKASNADVVITLTKPESGDVTAEFSYKKLAEEKSYSVRIETVDENGNAIDGYEDETLPEGGTIDLTTAPFEVVGYVYDEAKIDDAVVTSITSEDGAYISYTVKTDDESTSNVEIGSDITLSLIYKKEKKPIKRIASPRRAGASSSDLSQYLDKATINGAELQNGTYQVYEGEDYTVSLHFSETEDKQFPEKEMTYSLREAVKNTVTVQDITEPQYITIAGKDAEGSYTARGKYTIKDGSLSFEWCQENEEDKNAYERLIKAGNAEFSIDIGASFSADTKEISWSTSVTTPVHVKTDASLTSSKSIDWVDKTNNKIHYKLTVSSRGYNKNVTVTDSIKGDELSYSGEAVTISSSKSGRTFVPVTPAKGQKSFTQDLGDMNDGETVTIGYCCDLDTSKITLDAQGKYTVSRDANTVSAENDKSHEKEHGADADYSIDYNASISKTGKNVEDTDGDGKVSVPWTIVYNADGNISMNGRTITDTIRSESFGRMKYSGPVTVRKYKGQIAINDDGQVVSPKDRTSATPASAVTFNPDETKQSWSYQITDQEAYSYVLTYNTVVDVTDLNSNINVSNDVTDGHNSGSQSSTVGPGEDNMAGISKAASSVSDKEIDWTITLTVPKNGLNRAVITDTFPNLNNQYYDELSDEEGKTPVTVEGLQAGEDFYVQKSADGHSAEIIFTKTGTDKKTEPGLYGGIATRQVKVTVKTKVDQDWLNFASQNSWAQKHTNTAILNGNQNLKATADAVPSLKRIEKTYSAWNNTSVTVTTADDTVELPAYYFHVVLTGVTEKDFEFTDTYPAYFIPCEITNNNALKVYGGNQYYQGNECGTATIEKNSGIIKETENSDGTKTATFSVHLNGEPTQYTNYGIGYYVKVRDPEAYSRLGTDAANHVLNFANTAKFGESENEATFTFAKSPVEKTVADNTTEENGYTYANYTITLNPAKANLNNGAPLTLKDTFTNQSVDYQSISITTYPAGRQVTYDFSGNVGTFTVPDATKVVITYRARLLSSGSANEQVTATNTADFAGSHVETTKTATIHTSGRGSASNPYIKLLKYSAGNMADGLEGAKFALYKASDKANPLKVFTTDADGTAIIQGDQSKDDFSLVKGTQYILKEITAPAGYELDPTEYLFTIAKDSQSNYDQHIYVNGDTLKVSNRRKTGSISIEKTVQNGIDNDNEREFKFKVTVYNSAFTGTHNNDGVNFAVSDENGMPVAVAYVTVKKGNIATIKGLPVGTQYKVEEVLTDLQKQMYSSSLSSNAVGTIEADENGDPRPVTVTATNTRRFGNLEISKRTKIDGTERTTDEQFPVTIRLTDADGRTISGEFRAEIPEGTAEQRVSVINGILNLTIGSGKKIVLKGLPAGAQYKVMETNTGNYSESAEEESGKEGTIPDGTTASAVLVNARRTDKGSLKISKTIESDNEADKNQEFSFTVRLKGTSDAPIDENTRTEYPYGDGKDDFVRFAYSPSDHSLSSEITLKGGESKTIQELPAGWVYEVTERADSGFVTTYGDTGNTGAIIGSSAANLVACTNTRVNGLAITKIVNGTSGDQTKEFRFTITLDTDKIPSGSGLTFKPNADGKKSSATFTLKNGDTKQIEGLKNGTEFTVQEEPCEGYNTTYEYSGTVKDGQIYVIGGKENKLTVTNTKNMYGGALIRKIVQGNDPDKKSWFAVHISLSDKTITGQYGDVYFKDGESYGRTIDGSNADYNSEGGAYYDPAYKGNIKSGFVVIRPQESVTKTQPEEPILLWGLPEGVTYTVKEYDYSTTYDSVRYDGNGGTIKGIVNGIYTQDSQIPEDAKAKVTDAGNVVTVTNTRNRYGKLKIEKHVLDENGEEVTDNTLKFTFKVTMKDAAGNPLTGTFNDGTVSFGDGVATVTVSAGSYLEITGLPLRARFTVEELDDKGNSLAEGKGITGFDAPAYELWYADAASGSKPEKRQENSSGVIDVKERTVKVTNRQKSVHIAVSKKWDNGDGIGTDAPKNASVVFTLFRNGESTGRSITLDGHPDDKGEKTAWTADFGKLPAYRYTSKGAEEITYSVRETTTYPGYTPTNENGTYLRDGVTVNNDAAENSGEAADNGATVNSDATGNNDAAVNDADRAPVIVNTINRVKFRKVDGNETFLTDAHLQLKNGDKIIDEWVTTDKDHEVKGLASGIRYTLHEFKAPAGYQLADDVAFELGADGLIDCSKSNPASAITCDESAQVVTVTDLKQIRIAKLGDNNAPLSGAVFALDDENGKTIETWKSGAEPHTLTSKLTAGASYTLKEKSAPVGYTRISDTVFTVNRDGSLKKDSGDKNIVLSDDGCTATVTDTYSASGSVTISGRKILSTEGKNSGGRKLTDQEFTFGLYTTDGKLIEQAKNNSEGEFSFSEILYSKDDITDRHKDGTGSGEKTYIIREITPENTSDGKFEGVQYDPTEYNVTVALSDNGEGKITAEPSIKIGETLVDSISFSNTYRSSGKAIIKAAKTLIGKNLEEGEFNFELKDSEGKTLQTQKNDADGNVWFDAISYTQADITQWNSDGTGTGIKTYTLSEKAGDNSAVRYDQAVYTVTVNLTDDGKGTITATPEYSKKVGDTDARVSEAIFNNIYTSSGKCYIVGSKTLTGRPIRENEFTFGLFDQNGNPVKDTQGKDITYNDASGSFMFELSFSEKDITSGSGEKNYIVREIIPSDAADGVSNGVKYDSAEYQVNVALSDDGKGNITATPTFMQGGSEVNSIRFSNEYKSSGKANIEATKELIGKTLQAGEFKFKLEDSEGKVLQTKTNAADGSIKFDAIHYTQADITQWNPSGTGKGEKHYTVSEVKGKDDKITYDPAVYNITVNLTDDGSGRITTVTTYTKPDGTAVTGDAVSFTNRYASAGTLKLAGTKELKGRKLKPGEFTFELLDKDGNAMKDAQGKDITAVNDANGNFAFDAITYTYEDYENYLKEGNRYSYQVREKNTGEAGVTYDDTVYKVNVTLSLDGKSGEINAVPEYSAGGTRQEKITFRNTYQSSGSFTLSARKILKGRKLRANEFSFEVKLTDQEGKVVATANNKQSGDISFDPIFYSQDDITHWKSETDGTLTGTGTKIYTISEVIPEEEEDRQSGIAYDSTIYTVTVSLTDDGKGHIKTASEYSRDGKQIKPEEVIFTNTYTSRGTLTLASGSKKMSGRAMRQDDIYAFELKDVSGEKITTVSDDKSVEQDTVVIQNDATGTIHFPVIQYTQDDITSRDANGFGTGFKRYALTEMHDGEGTENADGTFKKDGVTYDNRTFYITVLLKDDGAGNMSAEATYSVDNIMTDQIAFTNTYKAAGTGEITGTKELTGRDIKDGEFTFILQDKDGKTVQEVTNKGNSFTFTDIPFTDDDITDKVHRTGTKTFTVKEKAGDLPRITYDNAVYQVTFNLTDNGEGVITSTSTPSIQKLGSEPNSSEEVDAIRFVNIYTPEKTQVSVRKVWDDDDNKDGIRPEKVRVQLYADDEQQGNAVELNSSNGWSYTWTELLKQSDETDISYSVREVDVPSGYTASCSGSAESGFVITNTHPHQTPPTPTPKVETTSVSVLKVWVDRDNAMALRPESIGVQLYADGAAQGDPVLLKEGNGWKYSWTNLPKERDGKAISYTVAELSVPDGYASTVSGSAAGGYTITNTLKDTEYPKTNISGTKVWDDSSNRYDSRPEYITVNLLANGEVIAAQDVTGSGDTWSFRFDDLPTVRDGQKINYTVSEVPVGFYSTSVNGTTITNTLDFPALYGSWTEEEKQRYLYGDKAGGVRTGDDTPIIRDLLIMSAAAAALITVLVMRRKKEKKEKSSREE
jgi:pilin isopeptide linkage protein